MVTITGLYSKIDVYIIYGVCCVQWTVLSVGNCCVQWTMLPAGNLCTMNYAVRWKLFWTMNCAVIWAGAHGELGFQTDVFVGDYCLQSTGLLFCLFLRSLHTVNWAVLLETSLQRAGLFWRLLFTTNWTVCWRQVFTMNCAVRWRPDELRCRSSELRSCMKVEVDVLGSRP